MKKKIGILLTVFLMIITLKVFATSNPTVNFRIEGEFKEGSTVDLILEVKDVDRLYGGQMDFTYNPEFIKVNSVEKGEFFNTIEDGPFDGASTEKGGQVAQYFYTYTGDTYGLKGSGDLVKVNLTVLKAGKLDISPSNMSVKLIERLEGKDPGYMKFTQNTLSVGEGVVIPTPPPTTDGSISVGDGNNNENNNSTNGTNTNSNNTNNTNNDNNGDNNNTTNGDSASIDSNTGNNDEKNDSFISDILDTPAKKTISIGLIILIIVLATISFTSGRMYFKKKK